MPKMKSYATFDLFYQDQTAAHRRIITELDTLITKNAPDLNKSVKWGNGVWLNDGTPVMYVHCEPDHVQFGFFGGSDLSDPNKVLIGSGKFVRHIKILSLEDIDKKTLTSFIKQANGK